MLAGCCIVYLIEGGTYCILLIYFVVVFDVSFRRILLVVMCCASVLTGVAERLSFDQFYALVLNYLGEDDSGEGFDVEDLESQATTTLVGSSFLTISIAIAAKPYTPPVGVPSERLRAPIA